MDDNNPNKSDIAMQIAATLLLAVLVGAMLAIVLFVLFTFVIH